MEFLYLLSLKLLAYTSPLEIIQYKETKIIAYIIANVEVT